MAWEIDSLVIEIEGLLAQAGFSAELYIIKTGRDYVCVMFDMEEAVEYLRVDFEASNLAKDCVYRYKREGKRHCALIYCK